MSWKMSAGMIPTKRCHIDPCRLTKDEAVSQALSSMFESVHYKEMGTKWVKHVSTKQSTPIEMKHLRDELEKYLTVRCSRKEPLCCVRYDVIKDLIRELIRQATIECPERGILLHRTIAYYENEFASYESLLRFTEAFIGRKRLAGDHWKTNCNRKITELEEIKRLLEQQTLELKHKADILDRKNQEAKVKRDAARAEEIKYYKKRGEHLKAQMDVSVLPNQ